MSLLWVVGATRQSGKTVVATGLAAALGELGFLVQAWKPLLLNDTEPDPQFMARVLGRRAPLEPLALRGLSPAVWPRLLATLQGLQAPMLLEAPGALGTLLFRHGADRLDNIDLIQAVGGQALLVVSKNAPLPEVLSPALAFAKYRGLPLAGWLAVETQPPGEERPTVLTHWNEDVWAISASSGVPCLGELGYSPSISVPRLGQGNLIRQTQAGVDLLPVQMALGLGVGAGL